MIRRLLFSTACCVLVLVLALVDPSKHEAGKSAGSAAVSVTLNPTASPHDGGPVLVRSRRTARCTKRRACRRTRRRSSRGSRRRCNAAAPYAPPDRPWVHELLSRQWEGGSGLALCVAWCESTYDENARNGKHASLFQIANGSMDPVANVAHAHAMHLRRPGWKDWKASRSCWG